MSAPRHFQQAEACIDWLLQSIGKRLVVGTPLGMGKPNDLLNCLYRRAKADPSIDLEILTALSLQTPRTGSELERRLVEPLSKRMFGDYPDLDYVADMQADKVPANITVSEFFFQPGAMLGRSHAQQHYRSTNYTHVARDLLGAGVNVLMQMVAPNADGTHFSLSSNPDVTLELIPAIQAMRERGEKIAVLAQANTQMPYMGRDAEVPADVFDAVLHADFRPFGAPAAPISTADYHIGLYASTLLKDGGTLQIGIGALSDAIAYCANLRQQNNPAYLEVCAHVADRYTKLIDEEGGLEPFTRGLYGCTEMLVDAYIQMYHGGVLKRCVYDDAGIQQLLDAGTIEENVSTQTLRALLDANLIASRLQPQDVDFLIRTGVFRAGLTLRAGEIHGATIGHLSADLSDPANFEEICTHCLGERLANPTLVHGGFFLGPTSFYQSLRDMPKETRDLICMTGVNQINQLYGGEDLRCIQRTHARFINTALKATLMGSIASDGLENGQVLSGVGGQYNFVSQAHALPGGRSILCVRATRGAGKKLESNIVWHYGYTTIPRHLRDIVISEYGIADLRGKTDAQVVAAMIEIADSRFQKDLREQAVSAGKLARNYEIPAAARSNTPQKLGAQLQQWRQSDRFPVFPFGSDFSDEEIVLGRALRGLKGLPKRQLASAALANARKLFSPPAAAKPYLQRMDLAKPVNWRERVLAATVVLALANDGLFN